MPIADNLRWTAEILMKGLIDASGSNSINTVNVFHFRRTTNVNALSKASVDAAFQTAIATPIIAALNLRWAQTTNEVRFIEDAEDAYNLISHANPGAITGDSMSSVASVFIYCKSALRGRNWQGSKKLGPISESDSTTGSSDILNAGAITRFEAIATAIGAGFTDANGNVWLPVTVSRNLSQLSKNPTVVAYAPVAVCNLNKRIGRNIRREVASVY